MEFTKPWMFYSSDYGTFQYASLQRQSWGPKRLSYLLKNKLPKGLLKNGRGNRLHLFFNQAEVYAEHHAVLLDYVRSNCSKNVDNLVKILKDYERPLAMDEFKAVGIMSRLLSAPWMSRFYRDAEKTFTYVEAF